MTPYTRLRAGAVALFGATIVLATACDGGPDEAIRATTHPQAVPVRAGPAILNPSDVRKRSESPVPARAHRADLDAVALHAVGEMTLPDGRVERQYRVQFANSHHYKSAMQAELTAATSGVVIVRGRVDLGDLLPGDSVLPVGTISLRLAPEQPLNLSDLQWQWHEHASPVARFGRMLDGPAEQLATLALSAFDPPELAAQAGLVAVLAPDADVGLVNGALRRAKLRIAAMRPGNHTLGLNLAGGGSDPEATHAALQALEASAAFTQVRLLPTRQPPTGAQSPQIDADVAALRDAAADMACDD